MVDVLVKANPGVEGGSWTNLGIWTFLELPRVGDDLMLYDPFEKRLLKDEGYYPFVVKKVYHVPVREKEADAEICLFVMPGYGNANITNYPPGEYHGRGTRSVSRR